MAKQDYIPAQDLAFLAWHDQFKTGVTANIATTKIRDEIRSATR